MAVGWKSLAGIVGTASVVCVAALYSVLVREPAAPVTTPPSEARDTAKPAAQVPSNQAPGGAPASQANKAPPPAAPSAPVTEERPGTQEAAKPGVKPVPSPSATNEAPGAVPSAQTRPSTTSADASPPAVTEAAKTDTAKTNTAKPDATKPDVSKADTSKSDASKNDASKPLVAPTFDIVRIEPDGGAVVAGRSPPGATVELLRNGISFARTVADVGGQWAIVPPTLPKGPCELTLRVTTPDGKIALSEQSASVRVPEQSGEEVVVVLNTPDQPSRILTDAARPAPPANVAQGEKPAASQENTGDAAPEVRANAAIRTVEADENGRFFVTGTAEPGATVRIYLNDTLVTTVTAAKDGAFGMTIEKGMLPGDYKVRVDDVAAATGKVLTRAEVPFSMADKSMAAAKPAVVAGGMSVGKTAQPDIAQPAVPATRSQNAQPPAAAPPGTVSAAQGQGQGTESSPPVLPASPAQEPAPPAKSEVAGAPVPPVAPPSVAVIPEIRTTTIVKGDSLWRISRKAYGKGVRYTWIYDANTKQIRDPNLIYPGQIFVMPDKKDP